MKRLIVIAVLLASSSVFADTYVNGYTRSDGTVVQGYTRTDANSTKNDNYSTQGNTNPYTGQAGAKPRDNGYPAPNSNNQNSGYGSARQQRQ